MGVIPLLPSVHRQSAFRINRTAAILILYLSLLVIAAIMGNSLILDSYQAQFWVLTGLVGLHNVTELVLRYMNDRRLFWMQPVVWGSIVLFLLQHGGLTNVLLVERGSFKLLYNNALQNEPQWLVFTMSIVLMASTMYWFGNRLRVGKWLTETYWRAYRRFWNFSFSHYKILAGLILGWAIKLLLNYYGGLGHKMGVLIDAHGGLPQIAIRLKVFENISLMFLLIFMYLNYTYRDNKFYRFVFIAGLIFEVLFGLTSGARSTLVFLGLALFLTDYYFKRKIRAIWLVVMVAVLYFSMTTLQGYKEFALDPLNQAIEIKNPVEYITKANEFFRIQMSNPEYRRNFNEQLYYGTVGRFNYLNECAQVIRYKNTEGLRQGDPDFITPFITFPVFAVLPQYYIFGVEPDNIGAWATRLLIGHTGYSLAISPIGYTYLAGGALLVGFIFGILGILMNAAGHLLKNINSAIALLLFFIVVKQLVLFDSVVSATFLQLIRVAVLLPIVLWFIFKK